MGSHPTGKRRSQLDVLITDATIDAYDESEQRMGFYTMIMDHLSLPFETTILGVPVVVESLEICAAEQLVAICRQGIKRQLPFPKRAPEGAEWIEAYRRWSTSGG
jgi:hypothetical protein